MKLSGKNAIITGANQGLGLEIARAFLKEGANLVLCARDASKLEEAVRELKGSEEGRKIVAVKTDVSDEAQVRALVDRALKEFPRIDILVNNAGVYGPKGPIEDVDSDAWAQAIQINLIGPFYLLKHVLPHMKKNSYGKIINLSGGGATAPLPNISAYAASKAALVRLTETIAEEVRATPIDINAIAPGALNTRLLDEVLEAGPEKVGKSFYERAVLQKKEGGAPLIKGAELVAFLASSESDGISGKLISAIWDPWPDLKKHKAELAESDIYTLRRITPKERGKDWN